MKTAVEFLFEEMNKIRLEEESGNIGALEFFNLQHAVFYKAKEKERQQIIDAHISELITDYDQRLCIETDISNAKGEIYYNLKYTDNDKH